MIHSPWNGTVNHEACLMVLLEQVCDGGRHGCDRREAGGECKHLGPVGVAVGLGGHYDLAARLNESVLFALATVPLR